MYFKSNEIVPNCERLWDFKGGLPIWPPFNGQMKNGESLCTFPDDFLNSYDGCTFKFSHLRQPFKNNVSRGKEKKKKSLQGNY